jgi:hypothetical protein
MAIRVMVEIKAAPDDEMLDLGAITARLGSRGFRQDHDSEPTPMGESGPSRKPQSFILYGFVDQESQIPSLEAQPEVISVWHDTKIAPFGDP